MGRKPGILERSVIHNPDRNNRIYPKIVKSLSALLLTGTVLINLACGAGTKSVVPHYEWKNITVGAGGFAPNIVFSRVEKNLAYLRTDMGGAYRWDQDKGSWLPLQDGMEESSYFGIESLAPDPKDPDVVYAAAGMYRHEPAAILHSANRGQTWRITPVPFRMGGNEDGRGLGERLAIDPNQTSILYFGSRHDGLFRSLDRGASWARVESFPHSGSGMRSYPQPTNAGISFVVFDPASGSNGSSQSIYVGVADPGEQHLYQSHDGGKTWTAVKNQPPAQLLPVQAELDDQGVLYVAYCNGIGPNGVTDGAVYKWGTRSGDWTDISPQKRPGKPGGGYMGISLDRQKPGTVVVASMNRWQPYDTVWYSSDGGASWFDIQPVSKRDVSATPYLYWGNPEADFGWWIAGLAIDPFDSGHVAYTTGATLYATDNILAQPTIKWQPWIKGIEQTAIITLTSLPKGPPLLSGFGDISGFVHEDLTVSPQVQFVDPVFANTNTIDYAGLVPNIVVRSGTPAHRTEGKGPTQAYSIDFGKTWQTVEEPEHPARPGDLAMVVSASGSRLMINTPIARWSADQGKSWHKASGLPENSRPVADKREPLVFYAMDFNTSRLFISRDGGETFVAIESKGLPDNISKDRPAWREIPWPLMVDPYQAGELWFVSHAGLFHSIDSGETFAKVETNIQVQLLSFGKPKTVGSKATLFAIGSRGGERAIWQSDDSGLHWIKLSDDEHRYGKRYRTLSGDLQHYGRVYVGTDGRGIVYAEPVEKNEE
ncbi:MAG: hypothetical protein JXA04_01200 [Gammaproteobacteria bacterium]|nr:hypothetical protein [Gammaproteobacteria bacterium]